MLILSSHSYSTDKNPLNDSYKELAEIFSPINLVKVIQFDKNLKPTNFEQAIYEYGEAVYGSRKLIKVSEIQDGNTVNQPALVNAPFLITLVDYRVVIREISMQLNYLVFEKHLPRDEYNARLKKAKKIIRRLKNSDIQFAFDGGAENECEAPTHRLLIFDKKNRFKIDYIDFDPC
jgi:hypothetical protein